MYVQFFSSRKDSAYHACLCFWFLCKEPNMQWTPGQWHLATEVNATCGDWGFTIPRKCTYRVTWKVCHLQGFWWLQIWENWLASGTNEKSAIHPGGSGLSHTTEPALSSAPTSDISPPMKLHRGEDQCWRELLQHTGSGPPPPRLGYIWALFFFKGTKEKEYQDYWCIKWLRNVCHLKPFHFLPDTTKKLFNEVSLCLSQCHYALGLFCPLSVFKARYDQETRGFYCFKQVNFKSVNLGEKVRGCPEDRVEGWNIQGWPRGHRQQAVGSRSSPCSEGTWLPYVSPGSHGKLSPQAWGVPWAPRVGPPSFRMCPCWLNPKLQGWHMTFHSYS